MVSNETDRYFVALSREVLWDEMSQIFRLILRT